MTTLTETISPPKTQTVTRAVEMPLFWPKDDDHRKHLYTMLDLSLEAASRVANAVIGAMYVADVTAQRGATPGTRLRKAAYPNTYQVAKDAAPPGMASSVFNTIEQWARKKYASRDARGLPYRYAAIVGAGSVPNVRRCPYAVRASVTWGSKARRPHLGRGGEPFVWLPLVSPDGGCEWVELQIQHLATRGHRRQYDAFRAMIEGAVKPGEIAVYRKPNGRTYIKFVGAFPVRDRAKQEEGKVLYVRTRPDAFLVASVRGRPRDWWLNADHVVRRIAGHGSRSQRLREDMKAEKRTRRGRGSVVQLSATSDKHQRFIAQFTHQVSRSVVNLAARHRCETIVFDDSERGYLTSFPWHDLRGKMQWKAQGDGMECLTTSEFTNRLKRTKATKELAAMTVQLEKLLSDKDATDDNSGNE